MTGDLGLAFASAARAMASFHAALLGPGYFHAQVRVGDEWYSFAGGPAWHAVDASASRNGQTRIVRVEVSHG